MFDMRIHRAEIVNKPFHTDNYNFGNSASKIQKCIILAFIYIPDFSISSYNAYEKCIGFKRLALP